MWPPAGSSLRGGSSLGSMAVTLGAPPSSEVCSYFSMWAKGMNKWAPQAARCRVERLGVSKDASAGLLCCRQGRPAATEGKPSPWLLFLLPGRSSFCCSCSHWLPDPPTPPRGEAESQNVSARGCSRGGLYNPHVTATDTGTLRSGLRPASGHLPSSLSRVETPCKRNEQLGLD